MRYKAFIFLIIFIFLAETFALLFYADTNIAPQNAAEVNEAVQSVRQSWGSLDKYSNSTSLDFTVLDSSGELLFSTRSGLSESINSAVAHRDTILDIENNDEVLGKIIIYNESTENVPDSKKRCAFIIIFAVAVQCAGFAAYLIYLNRRIIRPFRKLEGFAERVAEGNFDIPLEMDRNNIFGAFTEGFDIMRSELKAARIAEARANTEKKELVAKLSHDIRTPVASIKAVSEVGAAIAENGKLHESFLQIINKADRINTLVTNLFSATLEELQQLSVEPADMKSSEIPDMLSGADYLNYAEIPDIPECMLYADKLRLQQVFDNILANSYKYANTEIAVTAETDGGFLMIRIEDAGGGVTDDELLLIKEKFKRGKNSDGQEGAGLGLYISDCFMNEMRGGLDVQNGKSGLAVTVKIPLSGTI